MAQQNILLSPEAQADLIETWEYIAQFSEEAADKTLNTIYQKAELLVRSPYMGQARPELHPTLRSFPVDKYVLFYRPLDNDRIEIARVFHGARDIENLF